MDMEALFTADDHTFINIVMSEIGKNNLDCSLVMLILGMALARLSTAARKKDA